jgi:biotin carboxyl carrier protein
MTDTTAVRVRLTTASGGADTPAMVVGVAEPLDRTVLAQRHATIDGVRVAAGILSLDGWRYRLADDGVVTPVVLEPGRIDRRGVGVREVLVDGFRFEVEIEPEQRAALRERATRAGAVGARSGPLEIHAIIPGRVTAVWMVAGDTVTAGERVLAIEAMKMQNELLAPRDGTVVRVGVGVGETVEIGDLLVVIE